MIMIMSGFPWQKKPLHYFIINTDDTGDLFFLRDSEWITFWALRVIKRTVLPPDEHNTPHRQDMAVLHVADYRILANSEQLCNTVVSSLASWWSFLLQLHWGDVLPLRDLEWVEPWGQEQVMGVLQSVSPTATGSKWAELFFSVGSPNKLQHWLAKNPGSGFWMQKQALRGKKSFKLMAVHQTRALL